jgi:hypothetical protein
VTLCGGKMKLLAVPTPKTNKETPNFDVTTDVLKNLMKHIHKHLQPLNADGTSNR